MEEATRKSVEQRLRLSEVLGEMPEIRDCMDASMLSELDAPEQYLGVAEEFRLRQLDAPQHRSTKPEKKEE
jgi:hypothetical protein